MYKDERYSGYPETSLGTKTCISRGRTTAFLLELKIRIRINYFSGSEYWIGLNDRSYNGVFTWSRGETIGAYRNWATQQPDESSPPEDCVVLKKTGSEWLWHDSGCGATFPFLCQFQLGSKYSNNMYTFPNPTY
jgi:hypothetical protein